MKIYILVLAVFSMIVMVLLSCETKQPEPKGYWEIIDKTLYESVIDTTGANIGLYGKVINNNPSVIRGYRDTINCMSSDTIICINLSMHPYATHITFETGGSETVKPLYFNISSGDTIKKDCYTLIAY